MAQPCKVFSYTNVGTEKGVLANIASAAQAGGWTVDKNAVDADGADGVVDLQLFIDEFDAKNNDEPGYEADAGSAEGVDHIAPCRYSHQAGQRSV